MILSHAAPEPVRSGRCLFATAMLAFVFALAGDLNAQDNYRDLVLADGPDIYWSFDDSDDTMAPANLGAGTIGGTWVDIALGADGVAPDIPDNTSAEFDGFTSRLNVPDSNLINTGGPFLERSVSFWFNAEDVDTDFEQVLWDEGGRTRGMNVYLREGELWYGIWNRANDDNGVSTPWESGVDDLAGGNLYVSTPVESETDYHVAFVYKGDDAGKTGTMKAYLNGELVGEETGGGLFFAHGDDNAIGGMRQNSYYDNDGGSGTDDNYFFGRIDEFAIFNRALSGDLVAVHLGNELDPGDFNLDGSIDLNDYNTMLSNFNGPGGFSDGDFNFDEQIDLQDFIGFRDKFNSGGAAAVPEPSTVLLALAGLGLLAVRRTRKLLAVVLLGVSCCLLNTAQAEIVDWNVPGPAPWDEDINWTSPAGEFAPSAEFDDVARINNAGTAEISGDVTDVAGLNVNNGLLEIVGGELNVVATANEAGNGAIGGNGTLRLAEGGVLNVEGNANVNGELIIDGTTPNLSIGGDLNHSSGTTRLLFNGSDAPSINVTGAANLGGTFVVNPPAADVAPGASWNVVNAGSFSGAPIVHYDGAIPRGLDFRFQDDGSVGSVVVGNLPVLTIDRQTGDMSVTNVIGDDIEVKGYEITSASGLLAPGGFNGLSAQGLEGWDVANPQATSLAELNLLGSDDLSAGQTIDLGQAYAGGPVLPADEDVVFRYGGSDGVIRNGIVEYVGGANELTLNIDPATGETVVSNLSRFIDPIDVTGYSIFSGGGNLNVDGWTSFADSGDAGDGWREANPTGDAVAETNLENSQVFSNGTFVNLGNLFSPGSSLDLSFQYATASGELKDGFIVYQAFTPPTGGLPGDVNGDGKVDLVDFNTLKDGFGLSTGDPGFVAGADFDGDGTIALSDFNILKGNFGAQASAVPEPSTFALAGLAVLGLCCLRRRAAATALVVAATLFVGSSTAQAQWLDEVLADNPFALWRFDDPDGSLDAFDASDEDPEVVATYVGAVTYEVDGLIPGDDNTAIRLDGLDAKLDVPNTGAINTSGPWANKSIELWFNADDVTPAAPQVLYQQGGATRGANIYVYDSRLYYGIWNRANDDGDVSSPWISGEDDPAGGNLYVSAPIESGVTYHAALTYEGDEDGKEGFVRGYLDGALIGAKTGAGRLFNHTGQISIGAKRNDTYYHTAQGNGGAGDFFAGVIDDLALYNTTLSPPRIAARVGITINPGDYNSDGTVDLGDFDVLKSNFGNSGVFADGDENFDGTINLDDFFAFAAIFNAGGGGAAAVPEPGAWALALVAGAGLVVLRRPR